MIGLLLLLMIGLNHLWQREHSRRWIRSVVAAIMSTILLACIPIVENRIPAWHDSIAFNQDILAKAPDEYRAHYNVGLAYDTEGKEDLALAEYQAALAIKPTFADALINIGILQARTDPQAAIVTLKQAEKARPDYAKSYYNLGVVYQRTTQWDEAIDAYKQAISLEPRNAPARQNLATVYGEKKMFREALEQYQELTKIDPAFAERVKGMLPTK